MKQETAQSIIEKASRHKQIAATLDTQKVRRYMRGEGYRVRLVHRKA